MVKLEVVLIKDPKVDGGSIWIQVLDQNGFSQHDD
jgi:hypothetical protein